jgi:YVTN family beta-propeller protein
MTTSHFAARAVASARRSFIVLSLLLGAMPAAADSVVATVPIGNNPYGVTVSPDGSHAYAANFSSDTVSVVDTATNTVTATIVAGSHPYGIGVHPDGTRVYVTNSGADSVSVIGTATNTVTATIAVGGQPRAVAVLTPRR